MVKKDRDLQIKEDTGDLTKETGESANKTVCQVDLIEVRRLLEEVVLSSSLSTAFLEFDSEVMALKYENGYLLVWEQNKTLNVIPIDPLKIFNESYEDQL